MKKKILIVDDSESIRNMVGSFLRETGFDVVQGINGKDAIDKLKSVDVDLVITDLNMPIMDGIMLVKAIRNQPEKQYLPILILTTESEAKKRKEAKESGATGWIVKPFEKERLIKIINKVVR